MLTPLCKPLSKPSVTTPGTQLLRHSVPLSTPRTSTLSTISATNCVFLMIMISSFALTVSSSHMPFVNVLSPSPTKVIKVLPKPNSCSAKRFGFLESTGLRKSNLASQGLLPTLGCGEDPGSGWSRETFIYSQPWGWGG